MVEAITAFEEFEMGCEPFFNNAGFDEVTGVAKRTEKRKGR